MITHRLAGACACGSVQVEAGLTRMPGAYQPRACDCDFCRQRAAAWLSDPDGSLLVHAHSALDLRIERQGSGQAEFLCCGTCVSVLAVRWQDGDRVYGAVNARVLAQGGELGAEQAASPKRLDAEEKTARWKALWFADVKVTTA